MCAIGIAISIILPIWIYLLYKYIEGHPLHWLGLDVQFALKRLWARWCISKEKKRYSGKLESDDAMSKIKSILKPRADGPKIMIDRNSCNSIFFYATDLKGNSLFVKMNHWGYHTELELVELELQLILSDGRIYVLPDYPNRTESTGQKWSASGLTIELLEPRQRWRITYNGFLRNQCQGDISNDDNVEHVRLNCIFTGNSRTLDWPNDWSTHLHAEALAREHWRNSDWMNKIKLIDYTGFDKWGSIIGQVTFKDSNSNELYLRGLCQRRWGKQEFHEFHRTVAILGVTKHGAMYYIGASKTKNSFSHMQFGHIKDNKGKLFPIDWTDLKLNDFEKEDAVLTNYKIAFTANGKQYNTVINDTLNDATTMVCYNGQPQCWANTTRNLRMELNNSTAAGLMIMGYSFTGSFLKQDTEVPIFRISYLMRNSISDTFTQKDKYTLLFTDEQCRNESVVGGKGYSLAVLTFVTTFVDDFVVPAGFCVTHLALERQLQHHKQLQELIADIVDISCRKKKEDLESYCQRAVDIIQNTPVEEQIRKAILEDLDKLESSVKETGENVRMRYAVRSSAVGEDSEDTSAAGQNLTVLGVSNPDDIVKSVAKCWASLYTYQSVQYRRQNGLPVRASMGVCIQRMVDAHSAGVMFTRHPVTGDLSSIVITANYGLGETVVSGTVEPDTLTIHRKWDNTLSIGTLVPGSKGQKMSMSDDGVITSNTNEQDAQRISISDEIALQLAKIGLDLESMFGSARDVEWAVVGEKIFLLQARPITTINAWTEFELIHELDSGVPGETDLMTFANVEEIFPHPITPLTISTIVNILNLSIGSKFHSYDCHYLHMVGMRCAINYSDSILRDIDKKITMVNKIIDLALCGHEVLKPDIHKIGIEKYGIVSKWRQLYLNFETIILAWTNDWMVKTAANIFENCAMNADEFDTTRNLYNTINKKYKEIFQIGKYHNLTSLVSVSYQVFAMEFLTKGNDDFTSDHLADMGLLLGSCKEVISSEVPRAIQEIAECIRESGKAEEFHEIEHAKAADWLKINCPAAAEKLQTFFRIHGHRCVQELDFYTEFEHNNIISSIQKLTVAPQKERKDASEPLSIDSTIASLKTSIPSYSKWFFRKLISLCRKSVGNREMTKNIVANMVHNLRLAYKRLGTLMVTEGLIPDENLIFFLTHYEIGQILNNHNPLFVRKALCRKRIHPKVKTHHYEMFCTGMPIPKEKEIIDVQFPEERTKIEGTSVCGGRVTGRACVIRDLCDAESIQYGDILITHCTDIGWGLYFPLLTGIVTELGGLISHGAVVAREFQLPCIVGATAATQVFQTGDKVLLDASSGILELIEKAQSIDDK